MTQLYLLQYIERKSYEDEHREEPGVFSKPELAMAFVEQHYPGAEMEPDEKEGEWFYHNDRYMLFIKPIQLNPPIEQPRK